MDVSQIGIFGLATQRLSWLDRRQELLSQNVANTDTPGYHDKDLRPFTAALNQSLSPTLAQTDAAHLSGSQDSPWQQDNSARPSERTSDGNSVSLEDQLIKIADTETSHALVTNLYTKYVSLFRLALGAPAGS
jgi:flagellar basal-body rod protein FlgB